MVRSGFSVYIDSDKVKPFSQSARLTTPEFFNMFDLEFLHGSKWSQQQEDNAAPVVVISEELNDKLFAGKNSVGQVIYLDDASYEVIGVTKNWPLTIKYYDLNNGAFNQPEQLFMPFSILEAKQLGNWGNTNGWKHEDVRSFTAKNIKLRATKILLSSLTTLL